MVRNFPCKRLMAIGLGSLSLALSVTLSMSLSGCFGGPAKETVAVENKTLTFGVTELYQLSQLGQTPADGQYVVIRLGMLNNASVDRQIGLDNFSLDYYDPASELEQKDPKPSYSQAPEKKVKADFAKEFGQLASKKMLEPKGVTLHPRVDTFRYLVFTLPSSAKLRDYKLTWKPAAASGLLGAKSDNITEPGANTPISVPLTTADTNVIDKRSSN